MIDLRSIVALNPVRKEIAKGIVCNVVSLPSVCVKVSTAFAVMIKGRKERLLPKTSISKDAGMRYNIEKTVIRPFKVRNKKPKIKRDDKA